MNDKIIVKRRGRPKKIDTHKKNEKSKIILNNENPIEEDIILHLKICSEDENNNNNNTNSNFFITSTTNNSDNNINESEEYNNENIKIEDLYKKLQKKEILINDLNNKLEQLNLNNINNSDNIFNDENKQEYYNLNLLTLDNKKINIKNKCNLRCWNCTYKFDNLPCFIPEKYNDNIYYVFGCFCSFNCAASYNLHYLNDSRTNSRYTLIQNLYNKIFKNNNKIILASKRKSY